jgi:hypothetical protein
VFCGFARRIREARVVVAEAGFEIPETWPVPNLIVRMNTADLKKEGRQWALSGWNADDLDALAARCQAVMDRLAGNGKATDQRPAAWKPKPGYVGTKTICSNDGRYQKHGKNPPRTTLQQWQDRDTPDIDRDPASGQVYYPESWVLQCISTWNPRT